jgi:hypothetical protein
VATSTAKRGFTAFSLLLAAYAAPVGIPHGGARRIRRIYSLNRPEQTDLDERPSAAAEGDLLPRVAENDLMKRLMWSGLLAAFGALASIAANRAAATVWRRLFDEDPPD